LKKLKGDGLAVIEYHTSGLFNNPDGSGRANYYGLQYVPTTIFNGTSWYVGGSSGTFAVYNTRYNQQIAIGTPGVLSLKIVEYNPILRTGTITAKFHAAEVIQESDLRLRYAITESHKYYQWQWLDSLQFILRDMPPDYHGVSFWVGQGETYVDTQSFYIDPGWVDYNCELVVFVQSDKDTSVLISNLLPLYQTHVSGDANGDGVVTVSDVVFLTNYVLYSGPQPEPSASGDPNEDCVIDIEDVLYLMDYVFLGGSEPLRGWEID
jgi:hypothetical protein